MQVNHQTGSNRVPMHTFLLGLSMTLLLLPMTAAGQTDYGWNNCKDDDPQYENWGQRNLHQQGFGTPGPSSTTEIKNETSAKIRREAAPTPEHYREPGYVNRTGLTFLPGSENTALSVRTVNGYRLSSHLTLGAGFGFTNYGRDPLDLIPLFVSAKFSMLKTGDSPFVAIGAGRNISLHPGDDTRLTGHSGGLTLALEAGVDLLSGGGTNWYLKAGYNVDKATYRQEHFGSGRLETELTYRRLLLGIGLYL